LNLDKVNKLLIVRLSSLGDILLTTPLIRTIKSKYPVIEIDFVVRDEYQGLLKLNPNLSKVHIFYRDNDKNQELKQQLCENSYDMVLDLQNNFRSRRLLNCFGDSAIRFKKNNLNKFLLVRNCQIIKITLDHILDIINLEIYLNHKVKKQQIIVIINFI